MTPTIATYRVTRVTRVQASNHAGLWRNPCVTPWGYGVTRCRQGVTPVTPALREGLQREPSNHAGYTLVTPVTPEKHQCPKVSPC